TTLKLLAAIFIGRILFEVTLALTKHEDRPDIDWRAASWIWPWLVGSLIIGFLGRYGNWGFHKVLPDWYDLGVVAVFSLVVFYFAVSVASPAERVLAMVENTQAEFAAADAELAD
ncbi:MAG TPA: APC family permease, partial [Pseudonocardiaceae bacterium]|nr:APC family permease [Pseudonocardiaceae bacterium]